MANFAPLKSYMRFLMDRCVKKYAVPPPFLDAGCGKGDVSVHFAKKGWNGKAVDYSAPAVACARETLETFPDIHVSNENILLETETYNCIFLLDVLEHQADDARMMKKISELARSGGFLFLTVPVNPKEWGWDDEFYGHYRRYKIDEVQSLLSQNGFELREILNLTYPIFWMMRRLLLIQHKVKVPSGTPEERTMLSTLHNSWEKYSYLNDISAIMLIPYYPIQYLLKKSTRGFELLFVAQKK